MKKQVNSKEIRNQYFGDTRRTWSVCPVTQIIQSKKKYSRNREKRLKNEYD